MCQTITASYSCGCLAEPVSILCENPTSQCTRLTQTFQRQKLKEACPKHRSQRTSIRAIPAGKALRRRPTIEQLRGQAITTQPNRPYRVPVPENEGLRQLEHHLQTLQLSDEPASGGPSNSRSKRTKSGKSNSPEAVDSPVAPQSSSRKMPTRKPVPLNIMAIPVYDNGTNASYQEAMKLKNTQKPNTTPRERTSGQEDKPPPSSFVFGSSSRAGKTNPFNNPYPQRKSSFDGEEGTSLYPAPLRISKSSGTPISQSSRPAHHAANPAGIDKHRGRPLPAASASTPQKQARNRMMHKNSHNLLSTAYKAGVPAKAPHLEHANPVGESSRPKAQNGVLRHEDTVRLFKERQASEYRVLNAKRAFDNGRWNMYRNCYEMEVLTPDERREVNTYIRDRRDSQKKAREEAEVARQKRVSVPKVPERGKSVRSVKKKLENGCTVM